jgi:hypothetical protein
MRLGWLYRFESHTHAFMLYYTETGQGLQSFCPYFTVRW